MNAVADFALQEPTGTVTAGSVRCRPMTAEERRVWYWTDAPRDPVERFGWLLARWRLDPIAFAVECCRVILAPYQVAILLDLADAPRELYEFYRCDPLKPKRQVLVPSGHGLGKTRVLAVAIWWHYITHKFSMTLCTAPTQEQLSGRLWGELRKIFRRIKKRWPAIAAEIEILGTSIVHKNPDYGDWACVARTARPEKPEGLQGAHALDADDEFGQLAELFQEDIDRTPSGGMLIVIEEASGVDDLIRETLEGALSEEGARLIAPGNPTRPDGWFAEHLEQTDRYAVHHLDCRLSDRTKVQTIPYRDFSGRVHALQIRGFVRPAYWETIIAECDGDEDADRVRVRVRGLKPRSAFTQCIRTHWVEQAEKREPDPLSLAEPAIIALDFGLTSDKHGIAARRGFTILDGEEWLPKDKPDEVTLDAAQRAIDWQELYKAKYIIGDSNGVGRGAMEYLTRYYNDPERKHLNVTVIHFNAGAGAIDKKRFHRRRDEMWFKKGREFFANPRTSMPELPGLKKQLTTPGYHEDTANKIRVESKEEIFKRTGQPSGNLADAVLETLMVHVYAEPAKDEAPKHQFPKVFERHFARLKARRLDGNLIR